MKSESKLKLVAVLSVVIFVFAIFAIAFIFKDMSENIQIFFVQKRRWHIHDELWQRKNYETGCTNI